MTTFSDQPLTSRVSSRKSRSLIETRIGATLRTRVMIWDSKNKNSVSISFRGIALTVTIQNGSNSSTNKTVSNSSYVSKAFLTCISSRLVPHSCVIILYSNQLFLRLLNTRNNRKSGRKTWK